VSVNGDRRLPMMTCNPSQLLPLVPEPILANFAGQSLTTHVHERAPEAADVCPPWDWAGGNHSGDSGQFWWGLGTMVALGTLRVIAVRPYYPVA
jgi:hypothetical protein